MATHVVSCSIAGLKELHIKLLEQAGLQIEDELVSFKIETSADEKTDQFKVRCSQYLKRELSRVYALTSDSLSYTDFRIAPPPAGNVAVNVSAAWSHQPQLPPAHKGWDDSGKLEYILSLWEQANLSDNLELRFVMLNCICEAAKVNSEWPKEDPWPPRFAEIRLIRNLLAHGSNNADANVAKYLEKCVNKMSINRFKNRHDHLELARLRLPHLMSCVWYGVVVKNCVDTEIQSFDTEKADFGHVFINCTGPHPYQP